MKIEQTLINPRACNGCCVLIPGDDYPPCCGLKYWMGDYTTEYGDDFIFVRPEICKEKHGE